MNARRAALGGVLALSMGACAQPMPGAGTAGVSSARLADALQGASAGCPGAAAASRGRQTTAALDAAAANMLRGTAAAPAMAQASYRATRTYQVRLTGFSSLPEVANALARGHCTALSDPRLTEMGLAQQGRAWQVLLAAPLRPPPAQQAAAVAERVLSRVNEARAQARRCGAQAFAAAPPLVRNALLERAAAGHASDMAAHSYLEHRARDGSSPADRASRAGYRWRSIGENIAAGQATADEVVAAWVDSPEHCANLMNAGFTEMGVAYAFDAGSEGGLYWAQTLARPR